MDDKPLTINELRRVAAAKAWNACRSDNDPIQVPENFYYIVDLIIKECYVNLDKMILCVIKQRLDSLYDTK
jgi:hypothetical protein